MEANYKFEKNEPLNSNEIMKINKQMRKVNQKYTNEFVKIFISDLDKLKIGSPDNAYRNNKYLVQEHYEKKNNIIRLSICRTMLNKNGGWEDKISWDELFEIKNVFYKDFDAVEVFPAEKDLVNVANMRHLWILKDKLAFAWRNKIHKLELIK